MDPVKPNIKNIENELIALNKFPKKILIVEDDKINGMLLKMLLTKLNFVLVIAENGEEAVNLYKTTKFDAILMDIYMPIMDGLEASKRIRLISAFPPIIVISAAVLDEEKLKKEIRIDYFLPKPINIDKLKILLHKILLT